MSLSSQAKTGLGSALAGLGGVVIVLSAILGWTSAPRPWGFLAGLLAGLLAGIGVALAIGGLLQLRRER